MEIWKFKEKMVDMTKEGDALEFLMESAV